MSIRRGSNLIWTKAVAQCVFLFAWAIVAQLSIVHAKPPAAVHRRDAVRLTQNGSDRATAYVMNNKIVRRGDHLICTWLNSSPRVNQWAAVDPNSGNIVASGPLGGVVRDNHAGVAMAAEKDGTLHAIIGAHGGSFLYYKAPAGEDADLQWKKEASIKAKGTYPSLICDQDGTLHLTYRNADRKWTLRYRRLFKGESWSKPVDLVVASKPGYVYWTNALAQGPEGRLHLAFGNARQLEGSIYYGASHMYSDDSGNQWRQFGVERPLSLPTNAADLQLIENDALSPNRIQSDKERVNAHGPLNFNYNQMILSNPVIDGQRRPWITVHNRLDLSAKLYHYENGAWVATDIDKEVFRLMPGFRVHVQSGLSRHEDGTIEAILMVVPKDSPQWGPNATELVRVLVKPDGTVQSAQLVRDRDQDVAHWLPSIEQWNWNIPIKTPALTYTRGVNAGAFGKNINELQTEVWLELP